MAKPGKYAHVIQSLEKAFGLDPDYQKKVDAIKQLILAPTEKEVDLGQQAAVVEEMSMEIAAMLSVLNDLFVASAGGSVRPSRMAAIYRDLRKTKKLFEEQEKALNIIIEAYEQIIVDSYEAEDVTSLKLDDGAAVRVQLEPHGKVIDPVANRKWAMDNGLENLLAIPWQTVNALAKEALLEGDPLPDGVEITARPKVVYTKAG